MTNPKAKLEILEEQEAYLLALLSEIRTQKEEERIKGIFWDKLQRLNRLPLDERQYLAPFLFVQYQDNLKFVGVQPADIPSRLKKAILRVVGYPVKGGEDTLVLWTGGNSQLIAHGILKKCILEKRAATFAEVIGRDIKAPYAECIEALKWFCVACLQLLGDVGDVGDLSESLKIRKTFMVACMDVLRLFEG